MPGLIFAPHTSAGRLPTEIGLRFFVDAHAGDRRSSPSRSARASRRRCRAAASGHTLETRAGGGFDAAVRRVARRRRRRHDEARTRASSISSSCASIRPAPSWCSCREDGSVENRLLDLPAGLPASALVEAGNFLNARIRGKTLADLKREIESRRAEMERQLDALTARLVEAGLATPVGSAEARQLIVRGQANLLEDLKAAEDLERIRLLFADLETQTDVIDLLTRAEGGEGVRIFIGSENKLFSLSGSSMIAAPFRDAEPEDRRRRSA